jgi:hypothetical protein
MTRFHVTLAALGLAGLAHAAPPAPSITGGASNIKELSFAWQAIPQASRFELWFRATPGSAWGKYTEAPAGRTSVRINASVHLLDWRVARYHVRACDASGCSVSNEVGVTDEALAAIGYLKPNAADTHSGFGTRVGVSADGRTLAVLTGEIMGSRTYSAVIHVYRKTTSTSGWIRQARLLPNVVQSGTSKGIGSSPISLSADGNVLAVGLSAEDAVGTNTPEDTGAVYLFRRSGSTWRLAQKLLGVLHYQDCFGMNVDLDDAGRTLVVAHAKPEGRSEYGTLEIYRDAVDSSDQFVHDTTLLVPEHHTSSRWFCMAASLSGDGNTLLRNCLVPSTYRNFVQVFNAPGWTQSATIEAGDNTGIDSTRDGRRFVVQNGRNVEVFDLTSAGWVLAPGYIGSTEGFQRAHTAISRDGKIVASGIWNGSVVGLGPVYPPSISGSTPTGTVLIYELKTNGWTLRRLINPGSENVQSFGLSVALGDNGRLLAVGAPTDPSAATGIDGDRDDASAPDRGAVWLY